MFFSIRLKNCPAVFATFLIACLLTVGNSRAETASWFAWSELPPVPVEVSGAFAGTVDGKLVVAGGARRAGLEEKPWEYEQRIFLLWKNQSGRHDWREAGRLPKPLAFGAAVSSGADLICLGGENDAGPCSDVFALRYDPATDTIEVDGGYSPLPFERSRASATLCGGRIYIAGGKDRNRNAVSAFQSIPTASLKDPAVGWKDEPSRPGGPGYDSVFLKQNRGDRDVLYLIGGRTGEMNLLDDCRAFDPHEGKWSEKTRPPYPLAACAATPSGQSHLLLFGGTSGPSGKLFSHDVLAYHTITDTWCLCGETPDSAMGMSAVPWEKGIVFPGGADSKTYRADFVPVKTNFIFWDYATLIGYLIALALFGYYVSGWRETSDDFLLGKRRIPAWAAALSILATLASSIAMMSMPAKSYATNWSYLVMTGLWFVIVPIITTFYIPFFRSLNITSVYEYMEYRFHWTVRILAMAINSFIQLGRMAIVLYLPALALSSVTGIDPIVCILIMGFFSTVYTFSGGIEAIIWIDVTQAVLLFGGMLLCLVTILFSIEGGIFTFCEVAWRDGKFSLGTFELDPTIACIWVLLFGNFFTRFGSVISDQAVVHRFLTTATDREAQKSLWGNVFCSVPWALLVFTFGTALYVFFKLNPAALHPTLETDGIVPYYIAVELTTPGLAGLIIAAIFSASMSTCNSAIHSVATIWVVDVYARFIPGSSDRSQLWLARFFTLTLGVFGTGAAICLTLFDIRSLWDTFLAITGLFVGGLTGLFILAMFTKRPGGFAAVSGTFSSALVLWYVIHYTKLNFFLYSAIGCIVCVGVGCLLGFVFPGRREAIEYTVFRNRGSTPGINSGQ